MFRPEEWALLLEQAKQYTDSQQLGRKVKKTITWDGDTTGKTIIENNGSYGCKISDTPIDADGLTLKRLVMTRRAVLEDIPAQSYEVDLNTLFFSAVPESGMWGYIFNDDAPMYPSVTVIAVIQEDNEYMSKGIYLFFADHVDQITVRTYVSLVECEAIHPIPQEYIPPLDRLILNGTDGKRYKLFVDESGQLVTTEVTA